jgi:hypothetical protein
MTTLSLCHNVLTSDGWVRSTELTDNHKVALLDSDNMIHYDTIIKTQIDVSNGMMCFFNSKNINLFISIDSYVYCKIADTTEWKKYNVNFLVDKEFEIKKSTNGINEKNQYVYDLYGDSGFLKCGTYQDAVENQKTLIEHGYSVDREEIKKFNRIIGYILHFDLQSIEKFSKTDYAILSNNSNNFTVTTQDKYKMICVERCGKMMWIPV